MTPWKIQQVDEYSYGCALNILHHAHDVLVARARTKVALDRIAAGAADPHAMVWASQKTPDRGEPPIGACWIEIQPGGTGFVHLPVVELYTSPEREACQRDLLQAAEALAADAGVVWLQTLIQADPAAEALLRAQQYWPVSRLLYQAILTAKVPAELPPLRCTARPYTSDQRPRLEQLIQATYQGSLDCPEMDNKRSIEDVLASYEAVGNSSTRHWQLIEHEGETSGCLLLAVHEPEEEPRAAPFAELVYWGIVPQKRGQGLGREIVQIALSQLRSQGVSKLILAVDARNVPALTIYESLGFFEWLQQQAWGKSLANRGG